MLNVFKSHAINDWSMSGIFMDGGMSTVTLTLEYVMTGAMEVVVWQTGDPKKIWCHIRYVSPKSHIIFSRALRHFAGKQIISKWDKVIHQELNEAKMSPFLRRRQITKEFKGTVLFHIASRSRATQLCGKRLSFRLQFLSVYHHSAFLAGCVLRQVFPNPPKSTQKLAVLPRETLVKRYPKLQVWFSFQAWSCQQPSN